MNLASWFSAQSDSAVFGGIVAAAALGYVGYVARNVPAVVVSLAERFLMVQVQVRSDDEMYNLVAQWLSRQPFIAKSRRLKLIRANQQRYASGPCSVPDDEDGQPLQWSLIPAPGWHWMTFDGTLVQVEIDDGSNSPASTPSTGRIMIIETIRLRTFGPSRDCIRAILAECTSAAQQERTVSVILNDGKYWGRRLRKMPRHLNSVITKDGVGEALLADMRKFFAAKAQYASKGIPWRRGVMLSGPPGTGKSSLAFALASELAMPLYALGLGASMTDDEIMALLSAVPTGSIVLMEDVDTFQVAAARERKEKGENSMLSLSGLLNALDGVAAPEGRVLIMTSNHPEALDQALVRPGRVDIDLRLDWFGKDEALRMWDLFFPKVTGFRPEFEARIPGGVQPARLQEHLMRHADNERGAAESADELQAIARSVAA